MRAVLTTFDTDEHLFDVLRAEASRYLLKDARPAHLRDAVRVASISSMPLVPIEGHAGRYVLHCHNLEHEDVMMMVNFSVIS